MTDTLTDRERELVEAARNFFGAFGAEGGVLSDRLFKALRAYDPPKVKRYCMPSWEELVKMAKGSVLIVDNRGNNLSHIRTETGKVIYEDNYLAIREALATEE